MSDCVNPLVVTFTQKITERLQPRINHGCSAETTSTTTLNPIFRLKRLNMALEKLNFVSPNYENVRVSNAKSAMEERTKMDKKNAKFILEPGWQGFYPLCIDK